MRREGKRGGVMRGGVVWNQILEFWGKKREIWDKERAWGLRLIQGAAAPARPPPAFILLLILILKPAPQAAFPPVRKLGIFLG